MNYSLITTLILSIFLVSNSNNQLNIESTENLSYRQKMRNFVIEISKRAKTKNPNFVIIPQNGMELIISDNLNPDSLQVDYLNAIDGHGQESLFYKKGGKRQNRNNSKYTDNLLSIAKSSGKKILVTDYCTRTRRVDSSYKKNQSRGYTSFAADSSTDLNNIPNYPKPIHKKNKKEIKNLNQALNFLYLLDNGKFDSKKAFIDTVKDTYYDLLITDFYYDGSNNNFTKDDVKLLKTKKKNEGERLVIAYLSIGEAEKYRYYWKKNEGKEWVKYENPEWKGNHIVEYWNPEWQKIVYEYLDKIVEAGFDGVYLDIVDGYTNFE